MVRNIFMKTPLGKGRKTTSNSTVDNSSQSSKQSSVKTLLDPAFSTLISITDRRDDRASQPSNPRPKPDRMKQSPVDSLFTSLMAIKETYWETSQSDENEIEPSNYNTENQSPEPKESKCKKRVVYIMCVFRSIEDVSTINETFSGLCFVRASWREPKLDGYQRDASKVYWDTMWSPQLDIANVVGEPEIQVWKELKYSSTECFVVEMRRIKGTFTEPMELEEFPFDVQDLSLLITTDLSLDEVELKADNLRVSKIETLGFKCISQFKLLRFVHCEPCFIDRKSGLLFQCCVIRHFGFFLHNIMLVFSIISALSFATFCVDAQNTENRLSLVFILLLVSVAFKLAASQSVPQVAYLTHLDRYILGLLMYLFLVAIYHGVQGTMENKSDADDTTVDFGVLIFFFLFFVLLHVAFVIQVVVRGFNRRKQVYGREKLYANLSLMMSIRDSDSFHSRPPAPKRNSFYSSVFEYFGYS